jgi:hypothetical protein
MENLRMKKVICMAWVILVCVASGAPAARADDGAYDVVVYGGTSAGVIAAVQAARMGKTAVLIEPGEHLGGLSSGGLGWTDSGNKEAVGGLSREFYQRVKKHYDNPAAWVYQKPEEYSRYRSNEDAMWVFEPYVAEEVYREMIREAGVQVVFGERLDRSRGGVQKRGRRIASIRMESGKAFRGAMFIDATYEGDLMAAAGVDYHVGREANSVYGETWNGVQVGVRHHAHFFKGKIDPYVKPGDPTSGLLPRISDDPPGEKGEGDHRVQAYCFRMCLSNHPDNRVPFPKPAGYDPRQYELLLRVLDAGWREVFGKFDPAPNRKTDTNNHGPFSTDNIGMNYDYPEASYERREEILREHETYQKGLMYFLANDPRVPEDVRVRMGKWGLAGDEFVDNGNWPHQLYVREARRMIGEFVMIEQHTLSQRDVPRPVGMGSYSLDSHNVQRYVTPEGHVQNEGDIGVRPPRPYCISYGSLVPRKEQCENLLVPVCLSSSHIAYGSIRMEPVFMILGQSAATAACFSIDDGIAVQDLDYNRLRERLLKDGQIIDYAQLPESLREKRKFVSRNRGVDPKTLSGIVVDDEAASLVGFERNSTALGLYVGAGYRHDGDEAKGLQTARFEPAIDKAGVYEVRLAYSSGANRTRKVSVVVRHAEGRSTLTVDQRKEPPIDGLFISLGKYSLEPSREGWVEISNEGTDGHVIIDAVQFLPVP